MYKNVIAFSVNQLTGSHCWPVTSYGLKLGASFIALCISDVNLHTFEQYQMYIM